MKLRTFVVWSTLPLLGIIAAFGVMPQTMTESEQGQTVVQELNLPQIRPSGNASTFWRYERVEKGDTVAELLRRLNVEDPSANNYLRTSRTAESFRRLPPGASMQAEIGADGALLALRYPDTNGGQMLMEKTGNSFAVRTLPAQLERRIFMRTGEIRGNLFEATDAASLPEPAANQLADIFGGSIDFHHDLQTGDRFSVIYEVSYSNGEPVRVGRVLAAEFINRDRVYRALYFQNGQTGDYYTPEGHSIHRTFLRSPVDFTRISSGYTNARFHPILHKWGAHKGIDFAAPMGTKVRATAAGTIVFVGQQRGYGNIVVVKHQGRFSTAYGHLSRFVSHLHKGQHVVQGEIIGYVGKTGLATGPHLHYEFRVDGKQRNPLFAAPPDTPSISNEQRESFLEATHDLSARLGILHNISLAQAY